MKSAMNAATTPITPPLTDAELEVADAALRACPHLQRLVTQLVAQIHESRRLLEVAAVQIEAATEAATAERKAERKRAQEIAIERAMRNAPPTRGIH